MLTADAELKTSGVIEVSTEGSESRLLIDNGSETANLETNETTFLC